MNLCLVSAAEPAGELDGDAGSVRQSLAQAAPGTLTIAVAEQPAEATADGQRVVVVGALAGERFDVAIAADWRATPWLFEVAAERYALVVPCLEHTDLNPGEAERVLATIAIDLPVDLIAASEEVAVELRAMRPEARVFVAAADDGAALVAALALIVAEPPPAAALLPRRLMADLDAALIAFRIEYLHALAAYQRLERDEIVRVSTAIRGAYRSERLSGLRRTASPLVVRAKRRFGTTSTGE